MLKYVVYELNTADKNFKLLNYGIMVRPQS
jgi:hypothetical protein